MATFNDTLGVASTNVPVYSNGDKDFFSVERHYFHGVFIGYKWQCVEFVRRWLLLRKGCILPNENCAARIWKDVKAVERVTDGCQFSLECHSNGSPREPQIDSLLVYPRCDALPFGHIAVISEVGPGYVRIVEQNYESNSWSENHTRQLRLVEKDDLFYIEDEHSIYGWMTIKDNHELGPLDESKLDVILKPYKKPVPIGTLERCCVPKENVHVKGGWLDRNSPAEKYLVDMYGEDPSRSIDGTYPYYKMDFNLFLNIGTAANESHRMFMKATEHVINSDDLLARFEIPEIFWSGIRRSWKNDQDLFMTGRFDFAFDGEKIKVFEYNADSASVLLECAVTQQKWAKAVGLDSNLISGFQMHRVLVRNWKNLNIRSRVHLLIDKYEDEMITALYMQSVMNEAGIETKLCVLLDDLYWKDSAIVDNDGRQVTFVWKTWMWETVFIDHIDAQKERNVDQWTPTDGDHPRLSDILLNDRIRVVEPLWKVITSNKALLPTLWSMFPNHPNLLRTEWTLADELKQKGYAKKPIVGRCGRNVTLHKSDGGSFTHETTEKFADRDCIYQELFELPTYDGFYNIFGCWIVHGLFAGFCIREDQRLITNYDSYAMACCITHS
ncbi:unnamed protein product [Adineta ricciae]|uniref:Peptidase C51 domain-containing protein n=1 Tax=Adineta ricciae TaxID=249248 RepID=A0A815L5U2_ADIRI|nr:unnamed protein product [Adineta ricciae]CAF1399000.1 unnamed protein product [Adineta ricciae]